MGAPFDVEFAGVAGVVVGVAEVAHVVEAEDVGAAGAVDAAGVADVAYVGGDELVDYLDDPELVTPPSFHFRLLHVHYSS